MTGTVADEALFRMPSLGADMTEGRVVEWLVAPGEAVERGDLVAVIETDKSDIEVEVFEPCVFEEFLVQPGERVEVGTPIARIRPTGRPTPVAPTPAARPSRASRPTPPAPASRAPSPARPWAAPAPPEDRGRHIPRRPVTPRARRLARQRGIDLAELPADGIVTGDVVLAATPGAAPVAERERPAPSVAPTAPTPRTGGTMRRAIADRMARSWAEIPHYHVSARLDVTDLEARLARANEGRDPSQRLVLGAVLDLAIARAAADVGELNGWWRDGAFQPSGSVDLGVVLSLRQGGIVVPTITDADRLDGESMMARMRDLVERARRGRLRTSDAADASITVTSLGERGADDVFGIIHPPQVALVGLGRPMDEALVVDGRVEARRVVHVSVAGDHRAHDGASASRFVRRLHHHLETLP